MLLPMKEDEAFDVLHVRFFGLQAEVPQTRGSSDLIQKLDEDIRISCF
jgi:hypothetical protein